mmetsp:Transcript_12820/g.22038  ORF Transcript_12820/g.22038 Transcript_12820/m.22038 type:complete len:331 (-) Transcript_12820:138-1130(-)
MSMATSYLEESATNSLCRKRQWRFIVQLNLQRTLLHPSQNLLPSLGLIVWHQKDIFRIRTRPQLGVQRFTGQFGKEFERFPHRRAIRSRIIARHGHERSTRFASLQHFRSPTIKVSTADRIDNHIKLILLIFFICPPIFAPIINHSIRTQLSAQVELRRRSHDQRCLGMRLGNLNRRGAHAAAPAQDQHAISLRDVIHHGIARGGGAAARGSLLVRYVGRFERRFGFVDDHVLGHAPDGGHSVGGDDDVSVLIFYRAVTVHDGAAYVHARDEGEGLAHDEHVPLGHDDVSGGDAACENLDEELLFFQGGGLGSDVVHSKIGFGSLFILTP